jgi:UDP-2,3-diacylglucosamine hydrolase
MTKAEPGTGLSSTGRIAVLAGGGSLPVAVLATLAAQNHNPLAVVIEGEADEAARIDGVETVGFRLEDAGKLVELLKSRGVDRLVLAGSVARRPRLGAFRWNLGLLKMIPRLLVALRSGDDVLLRSVIAHMSANGIETLAVHAVVPDLLMPAGPLGALAPTERDWKDIQPAIEAARAIGALDIGQAAVAVGRRVIALEGIEGTDGLLARTRDLRRHGRIRDIPGGVLVKCVKPGQDERADLPAIGPRTVEDAHAAGLRGVVVEAGRSLVLDHAATASRADELGLFVYGAGADGR